MNQDKEDGSTAVNMESVMRRLKKLLALAMDPAAAPGEAANAMRMAQKLMSMHKITDGAIVSSEIDEFRYQSTKAATPPPWEGALLSVLSRAFGSRCYWERGVGFRGARDKGHWVVLAHKPQLEMIQYAFDVIRRQLIRARSAHVATLPDFYTRPRKAAEGDSFGLAFIDALSAKVMAYADQDQRITDALQERITERCGGHKIKRRPITASTASREAGAAAGAEAHLHRAAGGGGASLLRIGSFT